MTVGRTVQRLRQAWGLYQSESQAETVVAVALVAAVVLPVVWASVEAGEE